MSGYLVINAVSNALRRILWEDFDADPVVRPLIGNETAIVFRNPTETARDSGNRLSLWLYQITENEFVKNAPPVRVNGAGTSTSTTKPTPLALNLFYLLTPFGPSGDADHVILGKTMQTFYDNATVILRDPISAIAEELRIIFCRVTLEELTRVWESLREPYRLSVCYQARVVRIDSEAVVDTARVIEFTGGFGRELAVPA
ncbi:MAG: DUF4255 domain-containing protein [Chloroflexi bacterium]|nr:DUF4255 domain-containing protein [Chloroflexota bacterium]